MILKPIIFIFTLAFLFCTQAQALIGDAGQPGSFLRAGVGARALGMGNAFTALADDASASYWNPAGLALSTRPQLGSMLALLSLERQFGFVALTLPAPGDAKAVNPRETANFPDTGHWGGWGQWGISWISFSLGNDFEGRSGDTAEFYTFADQQNAYLLSHSRAIASWLSVGANAKFFYYNLAGFQAKGGGLDLSLLALAHRHLRLGVTVGDLLSRQVWGTGFKERFPVVTRIGLASPWRDGSLIFVGDAQGVEGQQPRYRAGLEAWFMKVLAGRLGYNENGLTAGGSVRIQAFEVDLRLDYGIAADPLKLGRIQQVSLFLAF